jgi:SNF2 family DNA or RNA helicase
VTIEEKITNLDKFKANLGQALIENKETSGRSLNFQDIFDSFRERDEFKN